MAGGNGEAGGNPARLRHCDELCSESEDLLFHAHRAIVNDSDCLA